MRLASLCPPPPAGLCAGALRCGNRNVPAFADKEAVSKLCREQTQSVGHASTFGPRREDPIGATWAPLKHNSRDGLGRWVADELPTEMGPLSEKKTSGWFRLWPAWDWCYPLRGCCVQAWAGGGVAGVTWLTPPARAPASAAVGRVPARDFWLATFLLLGVRAKGKCVLRCARGCFHIAEHLRDRSRSLDQPGVIQRTADIAL